MSWNDNDRIPWSNQLRRRQAGVPEWMAPPAVVRQARRDYLQALVWMQENRLTHWLQQAKAAPKYLSHQQLKHCYRVLRHEQAASTPCCVDVLRADHQVSIRHFSEDGGACLVIDQQSQRRMATYDYHSRIRLHTQDLGACTLVYQMRYDLDDQRWKIASFVQRLPTGWDNPALSDLLDWMPESPRHMGRDN